MSTPQEQPSPVAQAILWVSRISTVTIQLILPPLVGRWADQQQGGTFWIYIGMAVGLLVSGLQLAALARKGLPQFGQPSGPTPPKSNHHVSERRSPPDHSAD